MNGNERYILEGIIIVLIAAYIFYENVFMAVILHRMCIFITGRE